MAFKTEILMLLALIAELVSLPGLTLNTVLGLKPSQQTSLNISECGLWPPKPNARHSAFSSDNGASRQQKEVQDLVKRLDSTGHLYRSPH